jgi:hypothetical protein
MKITEPDEGTRVLGAALLLALGVPGALGAAGPAGATLPGANGKIAYANGGIWVAGPGGENPPRLTSSIMDADRVRAALRAREAGLGAGRGSR